MLTGTTVSARAQRRAKVYRLAIVDTVNPVIELTEAGELPYYRGFFERLRQLGFAEGQNLQIKRYSGEGQSERFDDMVSAKANEPFCDCQHTWDNSPHVRDVGCDPLRQAHN